MDKKYFASHLTYHYAMFEDEYYLKMQMKALKLSVFSILNQNKKED